MTSELDHLRTLGHSALRSVARGQIVADPDHPAWPAAELTVSGIQLLDRWNKQPPLAAAPAAHNADPFVDPVAEVVAHDQSA